LNDCAQDQLVRGSPKLAASTEQLAMKIRCGGRREHGLQSQCYRRHPQISTTQSINPPYKIANRMTTGTHTRDSF